MKHTHRQNRLRLIVGAVVLLLVLSGSALPLTAQEDEIALWTFMMYMNADTNLEGAMMADLAEIAAVGSTDLVHMVAQVDRSPDYDNETYGDWDDTRRYYITQDIDYETDYIESLGELDGGDPENLIDFLAWTVENFPAEHYMLVMSNHGGGFGGLGADDSNPPGMLELTEIEEALSVAQSEYGLPTLDILAFDACLMSQVDVIRMAEPYTFYVLGAAELVPGAGYEYTTPLAALTDDPSLDAEALGTIFIDSFMEYHDAELGVNDPHELYLVDTAAVYDVLSALEEFVSLLDETELEAVIGSLGIARANVVEFAAGIGYNFVDLGNLMSQIARLDVDESLRDAAQNVVDAIDAMRVYGASSVALEGSSGLSVYFPFFEDDYIGDIYAEMTPSDMAVWQDFLSMFYTAADEIYVGNDLELAITDLILSGDTGSIVNPPSINFATSGRGVITLEFLAELLLDDGSTYLGVSAPVAATVLDTEGGEITYYPDGDDNYEFTWDARMTYITDGDQTIPGLLQNASYQRPRPYMEGIYTSLDENGDVYGEIAATLYFDIDTQEVSIIYGLLETEEGTTQFELPPYPGDRFTPLQFFVTPDGEIESTIFDEYITFGGSLPVTYVEAPAEAGTWRLTMRMQDIAGNIAFDAVDVEIDNSDVDPNLATFKTLATGVQFAHPYVWVGGVIDEGDDTFSEYISGVDGNFGIRIYYYEVESLDELLEAASGLLVEDASFDEPFMLHDQYEAAEANGSFTNEDGGESLNRTLAVYVPENGYGYVFDVIGSRDMSDEFDEVYTLLIDTLSFFEPVVNE